MPLDVVAAVEVFAEDYCALSPFSAAVGLAVVELVDAAAVAIDEIVVVGDGGFAVAVAGLVSIDDDLDPFEP